MLSKVDGVKRQRCQVWGTDKTTLAVDLSQGGGDGGTGAVSTGVQGQAARRAQEEGGNICEVTGQPVLLATVATGCASMQKPRP